MTTDQIGHDMSEPTELTESHLVPVVTDRGFKHMPDLRGTHGVSAIRVYESSAASAPHIWLRATDASGEEATVHLTVEAALRLAEQIQYLARDHYQLREESR